MTSPTFKRLEKKMVTLIVRWLAVIVKTKQQVWLLNIVLYTYLLYVVSNSSSGMDGKSKRNYVLQVIKKHRTL